jgi:hypothetical protein
MVMILRASLGWLIGGNTFSSESYFRFGSFREHSFQACQMDFMEMMRFIFKLAWLAPCLD